MCYCLTLSEGEEQGIVAILLTDARTLSLVTDVFGLSRFDLRSRYMDDPSKNTAVFAYLQTLSVSGIARPAGALSVFARVNIPFLI